jgi:hypothetical protein
MHKIDSFLLFYNYYFSGTTVFHLENFCALYSFFTYSFPSLFHSPPPPSFFTPPSPIMAPSPKHHARTRGTESLHTTIDTQATAGKRQRPTSPDTTSARTTGDCAFASGVSRLDAVHIPSKAAAAKRKAAERKAAAAERKAAKRKAEAAEADAKRKTEAEAEDAAKYNRKLRFNQQWLTNNPGKTIEDLYRGAAAMKQSIQDKDVSSKTLTFTTGYATGFREAQKLW